MWSIAANKSVLTFSNAVSVEWFGRYADWYFSRFPDFSAKNIICSQTTCSINLDKYDKLETGLKFLKMRGKLGFFSSGLTMADLRFSVTIASSRDVLTMSTNTGARTLMLSFNILVFIGSSSQDFVAVFANDLHKVRLVSRCETCKSLPGEIN